MRDVTAPGPSSCDERRVLPARHSKPELPPAPLLPPPAAPRPSPSAWALAVSLPAATFAPLLSNQWAPDEASDCMASSNSQLDTSAPALPSAGLCLRSPSRSSSAWLTSESRTKPGEVPIRDPSCSLPQLFFRCNRPLAFATCAMSIAASAVRAPRSVAAGTSSPSMSWSSNVTASASPPVLMRSNATSSAAPSAAVSNASAFCVACSAHRTVSAARSCAG
mmetsp:Transcript_26177/g.77651  ORF Transcript_26177/g.77651 Transcript_26177/m.77651 type:complete len:221 (-) Transcript_26177:1089-1751(-)